MISNKQFRDTGKSFFCNKNLYSDNHISINAKNKVFDNEVKLVKLFNTHFTNAVESTIDKALTGLGMRLMNKTTPIMVRKSFQNIKIILV